MTVSARKARLAIGLVGLGRLGRVYARDLSSRIAETRLVAVADPAGSVAQEVAERPAAVGARVVERIEGPVDVEEGEGFAFGVQA